MEAVHVGYAQKRKQIKKYHLTPQLVVNKTYDGVECTVPVLLDGEESIVEFIDLPYTGVSSNILIWFILGRSFTKAVDLLSDIRRDDRLSSAILVLVANKTDLVRSRLVGEQEAKAAAQTYDCKYIEVSAILNHRVDELLVGVVKQLRHKPERDKKRKRKSAMMRMESGDTGCLSHCRQSALSVLFGAPLKFLSKSSDNLLSI
ncbi:hypothetical protein LSH36_216g02007 [Paralvinella palmiformis]|uniref:Uncharacterized protein n=1 Tax=Paralvinella palmiformis TaxID=53620 RepID=A0AAD9JPP3_9ANNE|nr:hypothetical protein LSH36_216g02007 [Paralvinella palmiformis]